MDESTGLIERRARTIVTFVLLAMAVWVFFFSYLPLDAGLWALQAELLRSHMFGGPSHDLWRAIPYPAANTGAPFLSALLATFLPGETVVRLALCIGAIFLRGAGMLALFRTLRVRDPAVYFLIPILAMTGLWYAGAMPYLMGETVALWVLVFFLSQDHPRSAAFWILAIGIALVSLLNGLLFLLLAIVVIMIMLEQRKSVHLSQGWLSEPRAVMSLLGIGALLLVLGLIGREPVLRLSATGMLPSAGFSRLLFLLTPAPRVLEATFRYGDILHALVTLLFIVVVLGFFLRAALLAIEEVTWQSRAVRGAGYTLLLLALLSPLFANIGIETSSGIIFAIVLILAGSYSRGPAVRRTPIDRLIYTLTVIAAIASVAMNAFSVASGSAAASDVLRSSRMLITQEKETAREDQHIDRIRIRFTLDSSLAAQCAYVGTLSYSATAPIYLFSEHDLLSDPAAFQPPGGMIKTISRPNGRTLSPSVPVQLGSEDRYIDSTVRILAALPMATHTSNSFAPFDVSLREDAGINVNKGEAKYHLGIGTLRAGHPVEMAFERF